LGLDDKEAGGVTMFDARFIHAGDEPPRALPAKALYIIPDDDNKGPSAFKADGLLDAATRIYLIENGHPWNKEWIAMAAAAGLLVVIDAGATFRAWFHHLDKLNLLRKTLAQSISGDPREKLQ
jgi:hypothetical protein